MTPSPRVRYSEPWGLLPVGKMSTHITHLNQGDVFPLPPRPFQVGGIGPLWALFKLSMRQFLRGRRALVVLALSLLPAGLALLVRSLDEGPSRNGPPKSEIEFVFLFNMIPHALLPLAALLYGSGLILDEQEDQTLTYLLIRPIPKWGLYVAKFLAAVCMSALLLAVLVIVTFVATYAFAPEWNDVFPYKMLATIGVMSLSMTAYVGLFGAISLLVKRSLIVGIIYIGMVEGLLSTFDIAIRKLCIVYYYRVLAVNWLDLNQDMQRAWHVDTSDPPTPLTCVLVLLLTAAATTAVAAYVFSRREFYVKTPEAN